MSALSRSKPSVAENWAFATRASCWKNLEPCLASAKAATATKRPAVMATMSSMSVKPLRPARSLREIVAFFMLASHVLRERAGEVDEVVAVEGRSNFAEIDAGIANGLACLDAPSTAVAKPVHAHLGTNEVRRRRTRRRTV